MPFKVNCRELKILNINLPIEEDVKDGVST